jgi:hypothetical protein
MTPLECVVSQAGEKRENASTGDLGDADCHGFGAASRMKVRLENKVVMAPGQRVKVASIKLVARRKFPAGTSV